MGFFGGGWPGVCVCGKGGDGGGGGFLGHFLLPTRRNNDAVMSPICLK